MAAKRCLVWGIGLCVVGSVLHYSLPDLVHAVFDALGPTGEFGARTMGVVFDLIGLVVVPFGTTLVGAAIVIEVLRKVPQRAGVQHDRDPDQRSVA